MPLKTPKKPQTEGSLNFDPDQFFDRWQSGDIFAPIDNDFRNCIIRAFALRANDSYIYRAVAEVTLGQAQAYLSHGGQGKLLEWYRGPDGTQLPAPAPADIQAYTTIFSPATSTANSIKALLSNAKKESLRSTIAAHLTSLYAPPPFVIPKLKTAPTNPYLDLWAWSCTPLAWGGPDPGTAETRISHALLPVLYHHFGCVVPSFDALAIIRHLAKGRTILDVGSGNGYWTYMLRRCAVPGLPGTGAEVVPIDSGVSAWRTMWIGDTVDEDGIKYLGKRDGGRGDVLLLVYPQVGASFTSKVLKAYRGDTVIVAGTQCANGYTAFSDETVDKWMEREMADYQKICQVPLPSFAGKDEALFAFQKRSSVG